MANIVKEEYAIEINVNVNITFVGSKNGTMLDYSNVLCKRWLFFYDEKGETVQFRNIIFNSYFTENTYTPLITATSYYNNNLYMKFDNCTFQNHNYYIFEFDVSCTYTKHLDPSFVFTNCNFYNNTEKIVNAINNHDKVVYPTLYECLMIKWDHCNFINNNSLFYIDHTKLLFNECYFSGMQKDTDEYNPAIFINSDSGYDFVEIKNSKFEDIHANSLYPLINAKTLILDIENTIFSNCHTAYGFLFDITNKFNDQGYIKIRNSTFINNDTIFSGSDCKINIVDSKFSNIISNSNFPAISYSKNSIINISNTEFNNLQ
ncbi:hypothetical protein BCR36DRAFT_405730 [Piromyces finnis]|uniref:Right handed beta helix domain-containing protein n=1 Tax=Piromyces finnis TaxID=1754191 RepID=A0A1Y1V3M5_9FUNG|nr:hypothetical protein BCR36DRAFT_407670 [Piromyces finnis]ORX46458.1 hypothetical protein BCR36DRAFT_405730 [Piromyces finnis]|eukprot:ORX37499.1 hypothetical protein BCR36DRAFT_407670 [Piromyces finnis]